MYANSASVVKELVAARGGDGEVGGAPTGGPAEEAAEERETSPPEEGRPRNGALSKVTIRVRNVPASKARDVVKVAVLPLSASASDVTIELTITADGGLAGIPRETLNLVVLEGLRKLGLEADVNSHDAPESS